MQWRAPKKPRTVKTVEGSFFGMKCVIFPADATQKNLSTVRLVQKASV